MATSIVSNRVLIEKNEAMIQVDIKPAGFSILLLVFDIIFCVVFGMVLFLVPIEHGWSMFSVFILTINLLALWESYLGVSWEITPIEAVANCKFFNFRWSYSARYITRLVYQPWKRSSTAQGNDTQRCLWLETDRGRRYVLVTALSEQETQAIIDALSPWFGVPISPESRFV